MSETEDSSLLSQAEQLSEGPDKSATGKKGTKRSSNYRVLIRF